MKAVYCADCGGRTSADEVALNLKMFGMQIGRFYCIGCMSRRLRTEPEHLRELISRFKKNGCTYFTRLMEDLSDEKENDRL